MTSATAGSERARHAFRIAIVGSGPAGLSAAARAAQLGISHVLLEAAAQISNTVHHYQKGKHVMAEPAVLPLRASLPFQAGSREMALQSWSDGVAQLGINVRYRAKVTAISGSSGAFTLTLADGAVIEADRVVLAIGMQGNLNKLGCDGEDSPSVQYQLDDPDAYVGEAIAIIGGGDSAIENALALAERNDVTLVNRKSEFSRAKSANEEAVLKAISGGRIRCQYSAVPKSVVTLPGGRTELVLKTAIGEATVTCDRIIARLGATPPRRFVEACGIVFPNDDPASVPAVSAQYESNVPGLYVIGALAGYPLIKQAMNQGYEVVEFIEGRNVEPADAPLLRKKFESLSGFRGDVDAAIEQLQQRVPMLTPLTALQLREFLLESELLQPKPGSVLFERNDYSSSFFSIVGGSVDIEIDPQDPGKTVTLRGREFFGEMGLISGRRRTATVRAGRDCVLIETPRRSMLKLIASVAAVKRVLDEAFLRRLIQTQIAPGVPSTDLDELVATAVVHSFDANEILFREGEAGDALHLIRRGSVTVSRLQNGREVVLAYVPAGQYVGEMALMSELPRAATVKAAVATETIRLDGAMFKLLMEAHPVVRERVREVFKARVAKNVVAGPDGGGQSNVIRFMMEQGLGEATDVLLIDESLCVRCDQCEKACASTHGNLSRLNREAGPTYDHLHVPTSCRHCENPHCMKDCPPDAIKRHPNGEVFITDACIGCGNCEKNCPYGVIQMGVESDKQPSLWRWMLFGGAEPGAGGGAKKKDAGRKTAAKCDMCKDLSGGPACVRACPTGAAIRVSPEEFLEVARSR